MSWQLYRDILADMIYLGKRRIVMIIAIMMTFHQNMMMDHTITFAAMIKSHTVMVMTTMKVFIVMYIAVVINTWITGVILTSSTRGSSGARSSLLQ